jgi:uncharacterized protein DUF6788
MSLLVLAMRIPDHPTLIRSLLKARLARLGSEQPLLAATLTQVHKRCGRKTCRCYTHGERHPAWHLTYKDEGKTHSVYVPLDLLDEVRSWIDNHKQHKNLLAEVHQLTLALVRSHVQTRKRKNGRP